MLIRRPVDIAPSEITPEDVYARRREFIKAAGGLALGAGLGVDALPALAQGKAATMKLFGVKDSPLSTGEKKNSKQEITEYNNFYEFGTDKDDPAQNAHTLITRPWTVAVEGEVRKPKVFDIDELHEARPARGARLPDALRRRLVDGDSLGRLFAVGAHQAGRADRQRQVRRVRHAGRSQADARRAHAACSSGPTSRACASTRRCIR